MRDYVIFSHKYDFHRYLYTNITLILLFMQMVIYTKSMVLTMLMGV